MNKGEVGKTRKGHKFIHCGTDKKGTTIQWLNPDGSKGKKVKLLNVAGRSELFAKQLKNKKDKHGNNLTKTKASWRSGYLQHSQDSARAFNAKNNRQNKSKASPITVSIYMD